jgi:hypothetical protein
MRLLPFRRTDSVSATTRVKVNDEVVAATTPTLSVREKRTRTITHPETPKSESKSKMNLFKAAITRPPRENPSSENPKRRNRNWFKRVFAKHSANIGDIENRKFPDLQSTIQHSTPTTCGHTASDETLSHDSPQNDESSQSDSIMRPRTFEGQNPPLLPYGSDEDEDCPDDEPRTVAPNCIEMSCKTKETGTKDVVFLPDRRLEAIYDSNVSKEPLETIFVPKFDRNEIIAALFPKGHPDEKPKRQPPVVSKDKIAALRQFLRQRKDAYSNIGSMVIKPSCDLESVESPVRQPSTIDSSACSNTTPENHSRSPDTVDVVHDNHELVNDTCESASAANSPEIIGMEIAWDPTWELLNASNSPVSVSRSKLRTLQDADKISSCTLGLFQEDDASADSLHLLDIPIFPSTPKESVDGPTLVLGFHFDPTRFPSNCEDEMEIVFEEERDLSFSSEEDTVILEPATMDSRGTFESSIVWMYRKDAKLTTETNYSVQSNNQNPVVSQSCLLQSTDSLSKMFTDYSDESQDGFSSGTNSSAIVENLIGLCSKE